jgi:hypothetical protein
MPAKLTRRTKTRTILQHVLAEICTTCLSRC